MVQQMRHGSSMLLRTAGNQPDVMRLACTVGAWYSVDYRCALAPGSEGKGKVLQAALGRRCLEKGQ